MTIPEGSNYPDSIDTNDNLFLVHDGLRMQLAEDYETGDESITVLGDSEIMLRFPNTGLITLTEQCSDAEQRAISFYYGSRTETTFDELELLPEFEDVVKPKLITIVTQNVMDKHHNSIKDAIIAIQGFGGKKGEIASSPLTGTMEARTNLLRSMVLLPKAWFSANKTIGLIPFSVIFTDQSFRLGTDGTSRKVTREWNFGDGTPPSLVTIQESTETLPCPPDEDEEPLPKTITHSYTEPGIYDVTLKVINDFGDDTVIFPALINARTQAPDEAVIDFIPRTGQTLTEGEPEGGPYTTSLPILRAPANTLIDLEVKSGENPNTGKSYAGEELNGAGQPIDPVIIYTWSLADDLQHPNSSLARASYSVGGVYDAILRVDTRYGAYRITTYEDVLDIVEKDNLWLWNFTDSTKQSVASYEFGLFSETFKTQSSTTLTVAYDDSFLDDAVNETQQKREFSRNNGFAKRGTLQSGLGGVGLLYWASGRAASDPVSSEQIKFSEFNGFNGTYTTKTPISRPWNWIGMASSSKLYFILGGITTTPAANTSPTNQQKTTMLLNNLSVSSTTLTTANYKNGAQELMSNVVTFDEAGDPNEGHMSVYRSCWRTDTGYFLRNQASGAFFRIQSFYKTSGTSTDNFQDIRKLTDMAGPAKVEGQLVPLNAGVFFFNNSGSISAYNPTSGVWETGGTGINSAAFRSFQDTSVEDYDDASNTLLAASDAGSVVYLSYDYSPNAFIKFNATDLTFSTVGSRPSGTQWNMQIF